MKLKYLLFFSLFASTCAFANINIINYATCDDIEGSWSGVASASALGGMIKCKYAGVGELAGKNNLTGKLTMQKTSGPSVCKSHLEHEITGTCENNQLTFKSDMMQIVGTVYDNGGELTSKLEGNLKVSGVKIKLAIDIQKKLNKFNSY
jgi:hypothetical protein